MANVMIEVKDLTTKYITRYNEDIYAVDHVSLKVEEGKTLGIAGESGCGKSTLALSLMGYYFAPLHYTSGEIIINGRNISGMDPEIDLGDRDFLYPPSGNERTQPHPQDDQLY
jgi:peptide/nickel transport system ATP-binding protein